jgi:hypothetical protein
MEVRIVALDGERVFGVLCAALLQECGATELHVVVNP